MPQIPQYFSQVNPELPPVTPTPDVGIMAASAAAPGKALANVFDTLSKASFHYADLLNGIENEEAKIAGHTLANDLNTRISNYRAENSQKFLNDPEGQFDDFNKQAEEEYNRTLKGVSDRRVKNAFESAFIPHSHNLSKNNADMMISGKMNRTTRQKGDLVEAHTNAIADAPDADAMNSAGENAMNDMVQFQAFFKEGPQATFNKVMTEGLKRRMSKAMATGNEEYFLNAMAEGGEIQQLIEAGARIDTQALLDHQDKLIQRSNQHADRERIEEDRTTKSYATQTATLLRTGKWTPEEARADLEANPDLYGDYSEHVATVATAMEDHTRTRKETVGENTRYHELSVSFWRSKGRVGNWDQTIASEYAAKRINAAEWDALSKLGAMDSQFKSDPAWEMAKNGVLKTLDPTSGPFGSLLSDPNDQIVINNAVTELYQYWQEGKADAVGARDAVIKKYKGQMKSSHYVPPPPAATHGGKQYNLSNLKEALALRAANPNALTVDQWKAVWRQLQVQTDNTGKPMEKK